MASNGTKRSETARFGVVLGRFGIAGRLRPARKFITFFYCRTIKFFCAASHRQTTNAYLRKFEGQHFRPPTQEIPHSQNALLINLGVLRYVTIDLRKKVVSAYSSSCSVVLRVLIVLIRRALEGVKQTAWRTTHL